MATADPPQAPGADGPASPGSEPRCHYCLLTPTGVVHDARGCVLVCAEHQRAREQQSMISGHRNCPLYYSDDGPLVWPDADLDAELAEDRQLTAKRTSHRDDSEREAFEDAVPAEILDVLSSMEWLALISKSPDGPLPPCCAEISELRDDIVMLLRLFSPHQAALVARQLVGDHAHDGLDRDASIGRLGVALTKWLDEAWPQWRGWQPPTEEDLADFEARARFGVDSPTQRLPRNHWAATLRAALDILAVPPGDERTAEGWLAQVHARLGAALTAGAPAGVVLALQQAMTHLLRAAMAEEAARPVTRPATLHDRYQRFCRRCGQSGQAQATPGCPAGTWVDEALTGPDRIRSDHQWGPAGQWIASVLRDTSMRHLAAAPDFDQPDWATRSARTLCGAAWVRAHLAEVDLLNELDFFRHRTGRVHVQRWWERRHVAGLASLPLALCGATGHVDAGICARCVTLLGPHAPRAFEHPQPDTTCQADHPTTPV